MLTARPLARVLLLGSLLAALPARAEAPPELARVQAQLGTLEREQRLLHTRLQFRPVEAVNPATSRIQPGQLEPGGGKLFLVHLWSVHCPPCRREMPALRDMIPRLGALVPKLGERLRIVFIAEDNPLDFTEGIKKPDLRVPDGVEQFLISPQSALRADLREPAQPLTLLLDRNMVVRQAFVGPLVERRNEVFSAIERFVRSQSSTR